MVAAVRGTAWVLPVAAKVGALVATRPVPVVVALVVPEMPVEARATAAVATEAALAVVQEARAAVVGTEAETATLAGPRVVTAVDLAATARVLEDTEGTVEAMVVTVAVGGMAAKTASTLAGLSARASRFLGVSLNFQEAACSNLMLVWQ